MGKGEESVNFAQLNELIKQKRMADIRSILLKGETLNLINKEESTLMHTAVMINNIEVIALLFGCGFYIDARNSSGQTPLLLAAYNNAHQVVQLLLSLGADILIPDANDQNALQVLLQKDRNTPAYLIGDLFERLRNTGLSSDKIVYELVKSECTLEQVLSLNNAEVTRQMLIYANIDEDEYGALLRRAMYTKNTENAKVLLEQQPDLTATRQWLIDEVLLNFIDPATRPAFEKFIKWDTIADDFAEQICEIFEKGNEDTIRIILATGVDCYYRKNFDQELLTDLFCNEKLNVIELLKNRQFNVNGLGKYAPANTALHEAVSCSNLQNIVYLLDLGADPNIENDEYEQPLSMAKEKEVIEILLDAGADLQSFAYRYLHAFFDRPEIYKYLIANVMVIQAQGLLEEYLRTDIYVESDSKLIEECNSYSKDLDWMKTQWISKSFNLFSIITEKPENLARYFKNKKTFAQVRKAIKREPSLKPSYVEMVRKKLKQVRELNELRLQAATFLGNKMDIADCNHLVITNIVNFLTYKDLLVLKKIEETMFIF